MISLPPSRRFFKRENENTLISSFIWSSRRARIRLTTLQCTELPEAVRSPISGFFIGNSTWGPLEEERRWRDDDCGIPGRQIEACRVTTCRVTEPSLFRRTLERPTAEIWHNYHEFNYSMESCWKIFRRSLIFIHPDHCSIIIILLNGKKLFSGSFWSRLLKCTHTLKNFGNSRLLSFQEIIHY